MTRADPAAAPGSVLFEVGMRLTLSFFLMIAAMIATAIATANFYGTWFELVGLALIFATWGAAKRGW